MREYSAILLLVVACAGDGYIDGTPTDASLAGRAVSENFALFAFNVSGAGSGECDGLYVPESFFQWSKTPSLSLVHPTTSFTAEPWKASAMLSRQTHGASSYWIVSSPRAGKWLYGQLVAQRQHRPAGTAQWLTLSGAEPAPTVRLVDANVSTTLSTARAEWEWEVLLASLLHHFGQEDTASSLLWASLSSSRVPRVIWRALHRRSILWAFKGGRLQEAKEHLMMGTEVEQQWIDEAACLLAVVEGDFSEAGLRHCARLPLADEGTALHFVGDLSAFHHFQVARALVPSILSGNVSSKDVHSLLIQPLFNAGLLRESMIHWEKTVLPDDDRNAVVWLQRTTLLPLVFDSEDAITAARSEFEGGIRHMRSIALEQNPDLAASSLPAATLPLCYHGENDLALIRLVSLAFIALSPGLDGNSDSSLELPGRSPPMPILQRSVAEGEEAPVVSVTVVSAHIRWHSVCRALCPTIEELARLDGVQVVVAFAPASRLDEVSQRVASSVSDVVYLSSDLSKARAQLRATAPCVLLYTDVGMNSWTTSLAHARLASVQLALWGHHGSSGVASIDFYIIADAFEPHESHKKHSEQLLRLQDGMGVFLREEDFMRREKQERRDTISRFDLGVRDDARIYLCAQSLPKFHPLFDYAMKRILDTDPSAIVVIPVDRAGQSGWLSSLKKRLHRTLGIENRCRVVFCDLLSQEGMFDLLQMADVSIDTFPVGGGITSLESLGNGIPTVTCGACQSVIRTTSTALDSMGISNLTAADPDEFVALAVKTANDAHFNSEMRNLLLERSSLLFERHDALVEWKGLLGRFCSGGYCGGPW